MLGLRYPRLFHGLFRDHVTRANALDAWPAAEFTQAKLSDEAKLSRVLEVPRGPGTSGEAGPQPAIISKIQYWVKVAFCT
ncbi:hypothetical protein J2X72_005035 [Phyllobacterium sp. 1468]|uniref:hypothetical protein n=1 Tax=Phyllobacterium sp. 1468 TaxID=2817759 RepID=UPI002856327C|nr:hypothetical protein [Phyllobacterium sp. 1468]MDR6636221.1 hypothetical protein [Phyllobacterium sp. 1468]